MPKSSEIESPPLSPGSEADRVRHNSKSETESLPDDKSQTSSRIQDRLKKLSEKKCSEVAESRLEHGPKGEFLKKEISRYIKDNKRENGEEEPTEEEIRKQIFLPKTVDGFKEPIKEWVENPTSNVVPGWNKKLLPENEIIRPPDWRPPTPPKVDLRLTPFIERAKQDATEVKEEKVKMEVTMKATEKDLRDLRGSDVILVMSSCGFVRFTKDKFLEAKRMAEDVRPSYGGGRFGGRGGGRGGRDGGRGGGGRFGDDRRGGGKRRSRSRSRDRDSKRMRRSSRSPRGDRRRSRSRGDRRRSRSRGHSDRHRRDSHRSSHRDSPGGRKDSHRSPAGRRDSTRGSPMRRRSPLPTSIGSPKPSSRSRRSPSLEIVSDIRRNDHHAMSSSSSTRHRRSPSPSPPRYPRNGRSPPPQRNYSPAPDRVAGGRGIRGHSPPPQSSRYSRPEQTHSRYSNSSPPPPSRSRYSNSSPPPPSRSRYSNSSPPPPSNSRQPLKPTASGYHHSISPSPNNSPAPEYYGGGRRSPSPPPQQSMTSRDHRDRGSFHRDSPRHGGSASGRYDSRDSRPRQESRHGAGGDRSESTSSGQPTTYAEYKALKAQRQ